MCGDCLQTFGNRPRGACSLLASLRCCPSSLTSNVPAPFLFRCAGSEGLLPAPGIGPAKAKAYGRRLLEAIHAQGPSGTVAGGRVLRIVTSKNRIRRFLMPPAWHGDCVSALGMSEAESAHIGRRLPSTSRDEESVHPVIRQGSRGLTPSDAPMPPGTMGDIPRSACRNSHHFRSTATLYTGFQRVGVEILLRNGP